MEHDFSHLGRKVMLVNARRLGREGNHNELTLLAIEDTTDRRRAEKALALSEKQRRLIMDAAPALISYVDRNLRYRLVNGAYQRWFGVEPRDLIGKSVSELFDGALLAATQPNLQRVLTGEPAAFEEDFPGGPDGCRTLQITYTPDFDDRGEVQGSWCWEAIQRHERWMRPHCAEAKSAGAVSLSAWRKVSL